MKKILALVCILFSTSCRHKPFEVVPAFVEQNDCNGIVPSFKSDIQPILKTHCAKSGCHDGNSMPHDFSIYSELKPELHDSAVYYYVVKDKQMPQDTPLSNADYHQLKCWIINNYPDN